MPPKINEFLFTKMDIGVDASTVLQVNLHGEGIRRVEAGRWHDSEIVFSRLVTEQEWCLYELYAYASIRDLSALRDIMQVLTGHCFSHHDIFLGLRNIHWIVYERYCERKAHYYQSDPDAETGLSFAVDRLNWLDWANACADEGVRLRNTWGPQNLAVMEGPEMRRTNVNSFVLSDYPPAHVAFTIYAQATQKKALAEDPEKYARYLASAKLDDLSTYSYPVRGCKAKLINQCFSREDRNLDILDWAVAKWPKMYGTLMRALSKYRTDTAKMTESELNTYKLKADEKCASKSSNLLDSDVKSTKELVKELIEKLIAELTAKSTWDLTKKATRESIKESTSNLIAARTEKFDSLTTKDLVKKTLEGSIEGLIRKSAMKLIRRSIRRSMSIRGTTLKTEELAKKTFMILIKESIEESNKESNKESIRQSVKEVLEELLDALIWKLNEEWLLLNLVPALASARPEFY